MEAGQHLSVRSLGYSVNPGGTQLFAVQIAFLGLAWISILLRGYVRVHMLKHVSLDDYLMFVSVVSERFCGFPIWKFPQLTCRSYHLAHLYGIRDHCCLGHQLWRHWAAHHANNR